MTAVEEPSVWEMAEEEETAQKLGRIKYGTHLILEEAANEILFGHLRTITSREEKADVLTPWKEKNRISHEVYNVTGVPIPHVRNGMFHRVLNRSKPYLNSRDGLARVAANQPNSIAMTVHLGAESDG